MHEKHTYDLQSNMENYALPP